MFQLRKIRKIFLGIYMTLKTESQNYHKWKDLFVSLRRAYRRWKQKNKIRKEFKNGRTNI